MAVCYLGFVISLLLSLLLSLPLFQRFRFFLNFEC